MGVATLPSGKGSTHDRRRQHLPGRCGRHSALRRDRHLATIGLILMIAGIVGLVIGLFMYASARRTAYAAPVERERVVEREPLA